MLKYSLIADAYEKIESTSKRLEMTDYLVALIKETPKNLLCKIAYLTQGKIYPEYMGIEIGIADKTAISAIVKASGEKRGEVERLWRDIGDLGETTEKLLSTEKSKQQTLSFNLKEALTVEEVYTTFIQISKASGKGSVESKVDLLTNLLIKAGAKEAGYLIRTVTGKLRLGIGDMTFLDALAIAYGGSKASREAVERAYNMSSDLGLVSETLAKKGLEGIKDFSITISRPIRPMLCERLKSAEEILEKLGGKGAVEFKYDGLRIQAHISPNNIWLFSRRLENLTDQFPDISKALKESITVNDVVVEGECVSVDPNTGEMQPFQVITQRRGRKYHVEEMAAEIPVVLILFDVLYAKGKTLVDISYLDRRKVLEEIVRETENIKITHPIITENPDDINQIMEKAIESGCEGVVIKSIKPESIYQAGARGFLWIKYKREYRSELTDTIDLVVVGAFAGRGRRAGTYGALLMAAYDEELDSFKTVCKLGTGFDDKILASLPKIFSEYKIDHIHPRVDSRIKADYWFVPIKVLEIRGSELTLSPSHTCGLDLIKKDSGLAVRFPRFTGRWRDDKAVEDATTVNEIVSMYKAQLKHYEPK